MKGRDRAVCQALYSTSAETGIYLLFAHMTHTVPDDDNYFDEEPGTALGRIFSCSGREVGFGINIEGRKVDPGLAPFLKTETQIARMRESSRE